MRFTLTFSTLATAEHSTVDIFLVKYLYCKHGTKQWSCKFFSMLMALSPNVVHKFKHTGSFFSYYCNVFPCSYTWLTPQEANDLKVICQNSGFEIITLEPLNEEVAASCWLSFTVTSFSSWLSFSSVVASLEILSSTSMDLSSSQHGLSTLSSPRISLMPKVSTALPCWWALNCLYCVIAPHLSTSHKHWQKENQQDGFWNINCSKDVDLLVSVGMDDVARVFYTG